MNSDRVVLVFTQTPSLMLFFLFLFFFYFHTIVLVFHETASGLFSVTVKYRVLFKLNATEMRSVLSDQSCRTIEFLLYSQSCSLGQDCRFFVHFVVSFVLTRCHMD